MTTRANRHRQVAGATAAVLLAACSEGAVIPEADGASRSVRPVTCLANIWDFQPESDRNEAFDRANDQAEGGSISCATGTTPSQFDVAIRDLRRAVREDDRDALVRQTAEPLLFIDRAGERREFARRTDTARAYDDIFDADTRSLMGSLALDQFTVVPEEGAFASVGALWLVAPRTGGRPEIRTINHQALAEARR